MTTPSEKTSLVQTTIEEETSGELAEEYHDVTSRPSSRHSSKTTTPKKRTVCPDYFGVRSYLHDFYEATYKDPSIYEEEDDFRFLLGANPRRRRCPPIWWKVFMWVGVNLLIFGIIGILVGYLVPERPLTFTKVDPETQKGVMDPGPIAFNTTLDVCKMIGLILFCVGGVTLAMALLFPSFLTSYCDEDQTDDNFKVSLDQEEPPQSPVEMSIPKTSKVKNVQPLRTLPESVVTQEGMVDYKD